MARVTRRTSPGEDGFVKKRQRDVINYRILIASLSHERNPDELYGRNERDGALP